MVHSNTPCKFRNVFSNGHKCCLKLTSCCFPCPTSLTTFLFTFKSPIAFFNNCSIPFISTYIGRSEKFYSKIKLWLQIWLWPVLKDEHTCLLTYQAISHSLVSLWQQPMTGMVGDGECPYQLSELKQQTASPSAAPCHYLTHAPHWVSSAYPSGVGAPPSPTLHRETRQLFTCRTVL